MVFIHGIWEMPDGLFFDAFFRCGTRSLYLKRRRGDGKNHLYRRIRVIVPDVLGLRWDTHTVALTECEMAGFHLKFHTFPGIEKGDYLADMSLGMQIGTGTSWNYHHAEFDTTPGIGGTRSL